jgi:hypothetical protein
MRRQARGFTVAVKCFWGFTPPCVGRSLLGFGKNFHTKKRRLWFKNNPGTVPVPYYSVPDIIRIPVPSTGTRTAAFNGGGGGAIFYGVQLR